MIGRVNRALVQPVAGSARVVPIAGLSAVREQHRDGRLVYCSGSFDLTHAGHVLFLEDCRRLGELLVVGVGCDVAIRRLKGPGRPVLNEHLRLKMIASLRAVDYCFLDPEASERPLEALASILGALRPDAYAVNADAYDIEGRRAVADRVGVPLIVLQRSCPPEFEAISTTGIIGRLETPRG